MRWPVPNTTSVFMVCIVFGGAFLYIFSSSHFFFACLLLLLVFVGTWICSTVQPGNFFFVFCNVSPMCVSDGMEYVEHGNCFIA